MKAQHYFILLLVWLAAQQAKAQQGSTQPSTGQLQPVNPSTANLLRQGIVAESLTGKGDGPGKITASGSLFSLNFSSSPQVHAKVVQNFATTMSQGDASKSRAIADVLSKNNVLGGFDQLLRKYGFNSHNLGDVFTAYVVLTWEAATGGDATQYPNGIQAFRKNMQSTMAGNNNLLQLSDAQKQETAETLSYMAILANATNQELVKKGDTQTLNQVRENLRQTALQLTGVDISQLALSNAGFGLRSSAPLASPAPTTATTALQATTNSNVKGFILVRHYGMYGPYLDSYVLFTDGSISSDTRPSPYELNMAQSKRTQPGKWGTWQQQGSTLTIQWPGKKPAVYKENEWYTTRPAADNEKISGAFKSLAVGGNTPMGGDVMTFSAGRIQFNLQGQFTIEQSSGGGTTNTSAYSSKNGAGTYRLNGYSIELHFNNGKVVRQSFYFYPKDKAHFGIGGNDYVPANI